jgi:hypothetical protein
VHFEVAQVVDRIVGVHGMIAREHFPARVTGWFPGAAGMAETMPGPA